MAALGFTSACRKDPAVEYGTPSAKFIVNGKIISGSTGDPIENIKVIMQRDTSFSDAQGIYQVMDEYGFPGDKTYSIQFLDLDGALNGEFQNLDTLVEFVDPQYVNGSGWYSGETSQEFDIQMNPK